MSQVFASGSGDKTVAMWDIRTSQCVQTFYGHNNAVNSCKFNIRVSLITQHIEVLIDLFSYVFRATKLSQQIAMASLRSGIFAW